MTKTASRSDEAGRLHRKGEPLMPSGHMYSMLDMMGATVTCDHCGNWQRLPILSPGPDVINEMRQRGWDQIDSKDLCPECHTPLTASEPTTSVRGEPC